MAYPFKRLITTSKRQGLSAPMPFQTKVITCHSTLRQMPLNILEWVPPLGGVLHSEGVSYSVRSPQGVAFNQSGNQCEFFDPTTEIAPSHALYIEPKFRLGSAIWQLKSLDLDHLLDSTADNHGLHAPLVNGPANRFVSIIRR